MSNPELDRLRAKHGEFVAQQSRAVLNFEDSDDLADLSDEISLAGARRLDPLASHRAALTARLTGQQIRPGSIDAEILGDIVPPLRGEVSAAADGQSSGPRLELVGIGSGSALLHFEPTYGLTPESYSSSSATDRMDSAIDRVLDAHSFVESNGDAQELREKFGNLLPDLGRLTAAMSTHDIELELLWRPPNGRRRPARLSRSGIEYARNIFEKRESSEEILAEGYVYSTSFAGQIILKRDVNNKRSSTYTVQMEPFEVSQLGLSLGDFAQIAITRTVEKDMTGREFSRKDQLVRLVMHQPGMVQIDPSDSSNG